MLPLGGITIIISLLVMFVGKVSKTVRTFFNWKRTRGQATLSPIDNLILSAFIITGLLAAMLSLSLYTLYKGVTGNNNFIAVGDMLYPCKPIQSNPGKQTVILRLDDVQSFGWSDVSMEMLQDALNRNLPMVAGVIPTHITDDKKLDRFLERNNCNIEIAVHGYTHTAEAGKPATSGEFAFLDLPSAQQKLELGKTELSKITKQPLVTFIPPENQLSEDSFVALQNAGFSTISSEGDGFFDYDAETWDFANHKFLDAQSIINTCQRRFASGDPLCVIMLHPQDFVTNGETVDSKKYSEYIKLLDYLEQNNIAVSTFSTYNQEKKDLVYTDFQQNLWVGRSGRDVFFLQQYLNKSGFPVAKTGLGSLGKETLFFGESTQKALSAFQRTNNIYPANGYFDAQTREKILEITKTHYGHT